MEVAGSKVLDGTKVTKNNYKFVSCFFCTNLQDFGESSETQSSFHQLSFRNIPNYLLSIHPNKKSINDFRKKLEMGHDLIWFTCFQCSQLTAEFNELYHLLEVTKIELNWCLEKMRNAMTQVNVESQDDIERTMRQTLREALIEQINGIIPLPRVALRKIDLDPEMKPFSSPSASECHSDAMNVNDKANFDITNGPQSPTPQLSKKSLTPSTDELLLKNTKVEQTKSSDELNSSIPWDEGSSSRFKLFSGGTCFSSCPLVKSSEYSGETPISSSPKLFSTSALSPVLLGGLHSRVNKARKPVKPVPKPKRIPSQQKGKNPPKKIKCSFCRAKFQECHASGQKTGELYLQMHVVQFHCEQLFPQHKLESVTDSQFKVILGELLFRDFINDDEDTFCTFCKQRFKNPRKASNKTAYCSRIKSHLAEYHHEELGESLRRIQENENISTITNRLTEKICKCGVYLQNSNNRVNHDKWHCPLTARNEESHPDLVNFVSRSPSCTDKVTCTFCNESVTRRSAIQHWNYFCVKGERLPVPNPATGNILCHYCEYKCVNHGKGVGKYAIRRHLLSRHLEHFFIHQRDSLTGWKYKHFSDVVVKLLLPKFVSRNGIAASCSACGAIFKAASSHICNLVILKRHLINNHKHELSECLKGILERSDALLEEQLKSGASMPNHTPDSNANQDISNEDCESEESDTHIGESHARVKEELLVSHDNDPLAMDYQ